MSNSAVKELYWIGSSLKDLKAFPAEVKDEIGYALFQVQQGKTPQAAKPLKGYGGQRFLSCVQISKLTHTERSIQSASLEPSMFCMHSRKSQSRE